MTDGKEMTEEQKKLAREEKKKAKELAKAEKAAKKEANRANRGQSQAAQDIPTLSYLEADTSPHPFGNYELLRSQGKTARKWTRVAELNKDRVDQEVWIRARLFTTRSKGKAAFIVLREAVATVQGTVFVDEEKGISKEFVKFAAQVPPESIVDVKAVISAAPSPIESCSQMDVELEVRRMYVVSKASPDLPFSLEDASRSERDFQLAESDPTKQYARVGQDIRLNNRVLDVRTLANQAIFRIQAGVAALFREKLTSLGFVEIHTPKIIGGTSEGGAEVFRLDYFGKKACLAQSPQLYKQMGVVTDLGRVFEIGPVFRAENAHTHRHLCEFVGLDLEMPFYDHYSEVLDVMDELFVYIFDGLNARFKNEIAAVQKQYPFEPLKYRRKTLRITYPEGVAMLRKAGAEIGDEDDLSTENERLLGQLVKKEYDTDFYFLDRFPLAVRPFYTMPAPDDPKYSNSYDILLRGEEIMSGAQRVHDPELLAKRAAEFEIPLDSIKAYVEAFKFGAQPHAGGGIGLERVVMLFLGLDNIRKTSLFPRDPLRLMP
eukprot:Rmarinus@m.29069